MFLPPEFPLVFCQTFMATFSRHVLWVICVAKGFRAELALLKLNRLLSTFLTFWHRRFVYDIYCQD
jgi:hypothetical protein